MRSNSEIESFCSKQTMAIATRIALPVLGCFFLFLVIPLLVPVPVLSAVVTKQVVSKNQTYTWGSIRPGDRQIAGAVLKFPPGYNKQRSYQSPQFAWGTRISAVQAIDMWQNGTNANITEVTYPADRSWVKIFFSQQNGKGMAYTVKVWGGR